MNTGLLVLKVLPNQATFPLWNEAVCSAFNGAENNYVACSNDFIELGNTQGIGFYHAFTIEPGLVIRTWVYCSEKETSLNLSTLNSVNSKQINFIGFQVPDDIMLMNVVADESRLLKNTQEFLCIPNNFEVHAKLPAGKQLKIVQLIMDEDWFMNQFSVVANYKYQGVCTMILNSEKLQYWKVIAPAAYERLLKQYFEVMESGLSFPITLKSKGLALLDYYLNQIIILEEDDKQSSQDLIDANIASVELLIIDNLSKKLPAIKVIAKKMSMSESTLKRKFKKYYGNSIYDFYLGKKMELARKLITEDGLQVSEVAYNLSYEKVSHFIEVFKRYYKHSPGKYKKCNV